MITREREDVQYQVNGHGIALLFVPGSFSTGAGDRHGFSQRQAKSNQ